jgi:hypothetical protein
MSMKVGPIDFTQASTWRGIAGTVAVFGFAFSPELTNQIAVTLAAALSAIEIFRDEHAKPALPPIELQSRVEPVATTASPAGQPLRQPMPADPESAFHPDAGNHWNG